ncbi:MULTISPECIES: hypothetical protein, partial [unclassified Methylibium]|uniref:hypothetical protein n=1 Tax=unclassified Methylibium TaxID=2633235 RepID=UPI001C1E1B0C
LVLGERGELSALSNELRSEALFYSVCFASLILDELRRLPMLARQAKADIATVTRRVSTQAAVLVSALFEDEEMSHSFSPLIARMQSVGT